MFSKEQRITSSKDILQVLRRGERRIFGCVSCYFLAKPGSVGKVTVIVDSKVARLAVQRNLLKRRVRAVLRQHGLPAGQLVVRLLKGAPDRTFPELRDQLLQCLNRLPTTRSNERS